MSRIRALSMIFTALFILPAAALAQTHTDPQDQPTATLMSANHEIDKWFPTGRPIISLDSIDGKGPQEFGLKGTNCASEARKQAQPCSFGQTYKVALPPGTHLLVIRWISGLLNGTAMSAQPQMLPFVAKSGHTYFINSRYVPGVSYNFDVVDLTEYEAHRPTGAWETGNVKKIEHATTKEYAATGLYFGEYPDVVYTVENADIVYKATLVIYSKKKPLPAVTVDGPIRFAAGKWFQIEDAQGKRFTLGYTWSVQDKEGPAAPSDHNGAAERK